jgi:hypothetical protein
MGEFICTVCHCEVHPLEVFPGPLCLACYAVTQEGAPMPTAEEIVAMWGGPTAGRRY